MKKYFIILILFFTQILYSQQQSWLNLGKATTQTLWKCSFVDTLNGWAVGDSGTIVHTSNGGYNWITQNSKLKDYIHSVYFINKRLGWALAWGVTVNFFGTYILKTTNGGNDWDTTRYPIPDTWIRTIYFIDSLNGYMGGNPAILLKTTDAGANWFKCYVDTTTIASQFPIWRFRFQDTNFGIACGGSTDIAGVFWKTTNAGSFWSAIAIAPEPLTDVKIFDTSNYLIVGGDLEYGASVCKTSNGGLNWFYKSLEIFGVPTTISFRTNSEAWCPMSFVNMFLLTTNTGDTWETVDTPDSLSIFDLVFLNDKYGIGVGFEGAVVKFNYASVNVNSNSTLVHKYNLYQNYPNPFNPFTNIEYSVSDISEIEIKIFNILGEEISTLFKGYKTAGKYRTRFYGTNLPSGIYFYRLITKDIKTGITYTETKKMILLK